MHRCPRGKSSTSPQCKPRSDRNNPLRVKRESLFLHNASKTSPLQCGGISQISRRLARVCIPKSKSSRTRGEKLVCGHRQRHFRTTSGKINLGTQSLCIIWERRRHCNKQTLISGSHCKHNNNNNNTTAAHCTLVKKKVGLGWRGWSRS